MQWVVPSTHSCKAATADLVRSPLEKNCQYHTGLLGEVEAISDTIPNLFSVYNLLLPMYIQAPCLHHKHKNLRKQGITIMDDGNTFRYRIKLRDISWKPRYSLFIFTMIISRRLETQLQSCSALYRVHLMQCLWKVTWTMPRMSWQPQDIISVQLHNNRITKYVYQVQRDQIKCAGFTALEELQRIKCL